jgi:hypothetical protein
LLVGLGKGGVMKKSLLGLMLGIAFLFGNVQEASALTGMELKGSCDSKLEKHKLPCYIFIQGVVYGFQMGVLIGSDGDLNAEKKTICFPKGSNVKQWVAIVKKYIEDHPEELHGGGVDLVLLSLKTAFPSCYVEPNYSNKP